MLTLNQSKLAKISLSIMATLSLGLATTILTNASSNNVYASTIKLNKKYQTMSYYSVKAVSANQLSTPEQAAKTWIANVESSGNYRASNGNYYGKYQLQKASLNGDYSKANQDATADQYVCSRYGSWVNAKQFWLAHNWY